MIPRGVRWGLKCGSRTAASLDSLHLIRGHVRFTRGGRLRFTKHRNNRYIRTSIPTHRRTRVQRRPGRVQFMLGRVVLYIDDSYYTNRRPARLRPMVGQAVLRPAAASGRAHCAQTRISPMSARAGLSFSRGSMSFSMNSTTCSGARPM